MVPPGTRAGRAAIRSRVDRLAQVFRDGRRSLIGASCMIVQPLLLNAISLPVTAYIIASIGPLEYGQWSVALTLVAASSILANLGLRFAFVRAVAQFPERAPDVFGAQLGLRLTLATLAALVAVAACWMLGYPEEVLHCTAILAIGALFTTSTAVVADLLQAMEKLPAMATVNFVGGLFLTAVSVIAIWLDSGPMGLAVAYLIGQMTTGILALLVVQRHLFPVRLVWDVKHQLGLLKQARVLGMQLFIGHLGNNIENLLVPKLVGLASYGYFAAGTLLPRRLEVVPDGLNTAFVPELARSYREGPQAGEATARRLGAFMLAACLPVALALFAAAGPIAALLFPADPGHCQLIIQITVWWVPLIGFAYAMGYAINASGRERQEAKIGIASTAVSLVLSVALITWYGVIGASIALVAKAAIALVFRLPTFIDSITDGRRVAAAVAQPAEQVL